MPVSLSKGQKVSLTKKRPSLKEVTVGLGWDAQEGGGYAFDLDVSAFLCAANGKCRRDKDFVFYNNLDHPSGSVIHMGDNRTGDGDGDDEQVKVILSKVPADIEKIVFTITIDDAERRGQNFGMVRNAYCRVVDENDGAVLTRYNLNEEASIETAVVMAELYRHDGEWEFHAIGDGYQGGLAGLCRRYGIDVE